MQLQTIILGALASFTAAQVPALYTDVHSGITFNTFTSSTGYFFGLALPANDTTSTDFIATIGGKGTVYSGVSLGGSMLNKLLITAWPNGNDIVAAFRKTTSYGSPAVVTGAFQQQPIANGTYVNSTHWTYTFLCSKCIQTDKTTFLATDLTPSFGYAVGVTPAVKTSPSSTLSRHSSQGQNQFDLSKARNANFALWSSWAAPVATTPKSVRSFVA